MQINYKEKLAHSEYIPKYTNTFFVEIGRYECQLTFTIVLNSERIKLYQSENRSFIEKYRKAYSAEGLSIEEAEQNAAKEFINKTEDWSSHVYCNFNFDYERSCKSFYKNVSITVEVEELERTETIDDDINRDHYYINVNNKFYKFNKNVFYMNNSKENGFKYKFYRAILKINNEKIVESGYLFPTLVEAKQFGCKLHMETLYKNPILLIQLLDERVSQLESVF